MGDKQKGSNLPTTLNRPVTDKLKYTLFRLLNKSTGQCLSNSPYLGYR